MGGKCVADLTCDSALGPGYQAEVTAVVSLCNCASAGGTCCVADPDPCQAHGGECADPAIIPPGWNAPFACPQPCGATLACAIEPSVTQDSGTD
jgi:hypothetical protein